MSNTHFPSITKSTIFPSIMMSVSKRYIKPSAITICIAACFLIIFMVLLKSSRLGDFQYNLLNSQQDTENSAINYVRQRHLYPYNPSLPTNYTAWAPYWGNFKHTMSHFVLNRLQNKTGGFFIECGAYDGQGLSNTLLLEEQYGWNGLLVEADPVPLAILKGRNRHAWVADVCLSPSATPTKITMSVASDIQFNAGSHIENKALGGRADGKRKFVAECFPLSVLLDAIAIDHVDYFSLDVEGVELDILKTIPFHRIKIQIINVEFRKLNRLEIQTFLESVGYTKIFEVVDGTAGMHDDVYELVNKF